MTGNSDDQDRVRAGATPTDVAAAAGLLTEDLYHHVPFESLGRVKTLLKQFFSSEPWDEQDEAELGSILTAAFPEANGWWNHVLESGMTLSHGFEDGRYRIRVAGNTAPATGLFDRVFSGPVRPEATPNPRHVRFVLGGAPAPGVWYRSDDQPEDRAVVELLADPDITDVLVAGDFVALGLRRPHMWEERLDEILAWVTELFWTPDRERSEPQGPTRDELVRGRRSGELHLLDPDEPESRDLLLEAARSPDARRRRMALVTLAQSSDERLATSTLEEGYTDVSRLVRRAVIDAAADLELEPLRSLFERALRDEDPWIRWKAIKGLDAIGIESSSKAVSALADDEDFQVRFEAAAVLRPNR